MIKEEMNHIILNALEEMKKQEARNSEMMKIITEYEEQNNIGCITEEEITDIFGIGTLYPNYMIPMSDWIDTSLWTFWDWESYYRDYGINDMGNSENIAKENLIYDYFNLSDDAFFNQDEWECELQDEFEALPNGMRTKTLDVFVTDSDEAIK
jgi:hypothetical protein